MHGVREWLYAEYGRISHSRIPSKLGMIRPEQKQWDHTVRHILTNLLHYPSKVNIPKLEKETIKLLNVIEPWLTKTYKTADITRIKQGNMSRAYERVK